MSFKFFSVLSNYLITNCCLWHCSTTTRGLTRMAEWIWHRGIAWDFHCLPKLNLFLLLHCQADCHVNETWIKLHPFFFLSLFARNVHAPNNVPVPVWPICGATLAPRKLGKGEAFLGFWAC